MSKIVKNIAYLALLTEGASATKLVQKSIMSLEDLKPSKGDDISLVDTSIRSEVARNFAEAESMDLDDEPKEPKAMAVVPPQPNNNGTLAQSGSVPAGKNP